MPNPSILNDNKVGELTISNKLSATAKKTRILSGLKSATLVSLGQLADDGCTTTITTPELIVKKNGKIILHGKHNYRDGLDDIPIYKTTITPDNYVTPCLHCVQTKLGPRDAELSTTTINNKNKNKKVSFNTSPTKLQQKKQHIQNPYNVNNTSKQCMQAILKTTMHKDHKINVILRKQQKSSDLAKFLHGCCCTPVPSTFITAIKSNHFYNMAWFDTRINS